MRLIHYLFALGLTVATGSAMAPDSVAGTAGYRERIAMPPDVIFKARLEDVSRANAPSKLIGSMVNEEASKPPFVFSIDYDPADIDDRNSYVVRARSGAIRSWWPRAGTSRASASCPGMTGLARRSAATRSMEDAS